MKEIIITWNIYTCSNLTKQKTVKFLFIPNQQKETEDKQEEYVIKLMNT